jgi:hypothetical protein
VSETSKGKYRKGDALLYSLTLAEASSNLFDGEGRCSCSKLAHHIGGLRKFVARLELRFGRGLFASSSPSSTS